MSTTLEQLQRQSRQLHHAMNAATDDTAATVLGLMRGLAMAVAIVHEHPERFESMAKETLETNRENLAALIRAGRTQVFGVASMQLDVEFTPEAKEVLAPLTGDLIDADLRAIVADNDRRNRMAEILATEYGFHVVAP